MKEKLMGTFRFIIKIIILLIPAVLFSLVLINIDYLDMLSLGAKMIVIGFTIFLIPLEFILWIMVFELDCFKNI